MEEETDQERSRAWSPGLLIPRARGKRRVDWHTGPHRSGHLLSNLSPELQGLNPSPEHPPEEERKPKTPDG